MDVVCGWVLNYLMINKIFVRFNCINISIRFLKGEQSLNYGGKVILTLLMRKSLFFALYILD